MSPKYFDIHSHLNSSHYQDDLDEVIERLRENETYTIVVGTDLESSKRAVELANKHQEIYATIGIHPVDDNTQVFETEDFEELVKHPKVVAIGECGLDFFHADREEDYKRQEKLFSDQINFALTHNKPLMLHVRPTPGTMNAYEDVLSILATYHLPPTTKLRGNVHFFAGDVNVAKKFFNLGFSVSFTGVITFTNDYDEVVRSAPLDRIMSETDSPYVTPVPHRGKRNEPVFVSEVVKRIAEIRGEKEEIVRTALVNNALSMIG